MNKAEMAELWAEVKANHARLDTCDGHDFEPRTGGLQQRKRRCRRCGGELDCVDAAWYEKGVEHGRATTKETT